MTKHTPGPWEVVVNDRTNTALIRREGGMEMIAERPYAGDPGSPVRSQVLANAALQASAPELFDALQKCLQWLDNLEDQDAIKSQIAFMDAMPNDFSRLIARAAIAKAMGAE